MAVGCALGLGIWVLTWFAGMLIVGDRSQYVGWVCLGGPALGLIAYATGYTLARHRQGARALQPAE
jgi:hypothetical protein